VSLPANLVAGHPHSRIVILLPDLAPLLWFATATVSTYCFSTQVLDVIDTDAWMVPRIWGRSMIPDEEFCPRREFLEAVRSTLLLLGPTGGRPGEMLPYTDHRMLG
jgi:hypothetical protein